MPPGVIIPEIPYPDVNQAAEWLARAFGLMERLRIGNHRVQLTFEGASIVATSSGGTPVKPCSILVHVEDVDAHHDRAVEHGAQVQKPPADYPYGERQYTARDPAGHAWTFSQTIKDVDPADWGGVLLSPT
jgi:uncharacterized glyoxalase superfamily protein PhnB